MTSRQLLRPAVEGPACWQTVPLKVIAILGLVPRLAVPVLVVAVQVLAGAVQVLAVAVLAMVVWMQNRLFDMRRHCEVLARDRRMC